MRELSLFTGAGGGLLGAKLLGWEHIGYVEINEYCQKVIRQRIEDGILDKAPIFTDVREFLQSGAAREYRGFADVVTAGFPCQPFSVAGKQQGEDDPRNMWPATIGVIRAVRPRIVYLENVPGLLTGFQRILYRLVRKNTGWLGRIAIKACFPSYFGRVLGDLAESGFDARWRVLSAAEVGASHDRERLWIVAYSMQSGLQMGRKAAKNRENEKSIEKGSGFTERTETAWLECCSASGWSGKIHGVANRVDRIKALGNGQVPAVVATAYRLLTNQNNQL